MDLPSLSFSKLNSIRTRGAFCGAGVASFFGYLEYTAPGSLTSLDVNGLISNPFNPILIIPPIIVAVGMILPAGLQKLGGLAKIRLPRGSNEKKNADVTQEQHGQSAGPGQELAPAPPAMLVPAAPPSLPPAQFDETKLSEVIKSKTSYLHDEVELVRKEFSSVRGDIDGLKGEIRELTSTFESSLVELKAFQAEMVNPINFMRKYFELLDIKSVSDPSTPMLPIGQLVNNSSESQNAGKPSITNLNQPEAPETEQRESQQLPSKALLSGTDADFHTLRQGEGIPRHDNRRISSAPPAVNQGLTPERIAEKILSKKRAGSLDLGVGNENIIQSSLRSGLTPGRIMSIVSIVDEILAAMGPDGIELVLEQYRALGLRPEEERLIYGVVRMLNESKLLTDDIIAILYRFGQVLGINDEDAELQYMKTIANKRNAEHNNPGLHRKGTSSTGSAG
jgi:hypothetical protein